MLLLVLSLALADNQPHNRKMPAARLLRLRLHVKLRRIRCMVKARSTGSNYDFLAAPSYSTRQVDGSRDVLVNDNKARYARLSKSSIKPQH